MRRSKVERFVWKWKRCETFRIKDCNTGHHVEGLGPVRNGAGISAAIAALQQLEKNLMTGMAIGSSSRYIIGTEWKQLKCLYDKDRTPRGACSTF
jgi:hypothetical protein